MPGLFLTICFNLPGGFDPHYDGTYLSGCIWNSLTTPMSAKFEIKRAKNGQFMFNLKATNGEIILTSETYKTKAGAQKGIESVQTNALIDHRYDQRTSTTDKPYFVLKARNGEIIGVSEFYSSIQAMKVGIASVKRNAREATVLDKTSQFPRLKNDKKRRSHHQTNPTAIMANMFYITHIDNKSETKSLTIACPYREYGGYQPWCKLSLGTLKYASASENQGQPLTISLSDKDSLNEAKATVTGKEDGNDIDYTEGFHISHGVTEGGKEFPERDPSLTWLKNNYLILEPQTSVKFIDLIIPWASKNQKLVIASTNVDGDEELALLDLGPGNFNLQADKDYGACIRYWSFGGEVVENDCYSIGMPDVINFKLRPSILIKVGLQWEEVGRTDLDHVFQLIHNTVTQLHGHALFCTRTSWQSA